MLIATETTQPARAITPMAYPDNDREFLIDVLVGTLRGNTDNWTVQGGDGVDELCRVHGYTPLVSWRARQAGATVTMRGRIEADLSGIDRLRVRAMAGSDQTVRLRACVDGQWVDAGAAVEGLDDYTELDDPVSGKRLTAVDVICTATKPGTMTNGVMWVMVVLPGEIKPWPKPDASWPGMLRDTIDRFEPTAGLLGDAAALDRWREQLKEPALAELWSKQVEIADAAMLLEPESFANPITPYSKERFGRPNCPDRAQFYHAVSLATVGLVEKRADMLRHAARFALVWSQCKRWVQYGLEAVEGLGYNHGRFAQAAAARNISVIFDRAGCALTDAGQAEVARAIRHLGVLDIDPIMKPESYVWKMNQGIVFDNGRLIGAIATDRWYPGELPRRMDEAQAMLKSVLTKAFSPDGGAEEGPSYWSYTLGNVPDTVMHLMRARGGTAADYLPPEVAASAMWALTNLRTDTDQSMMLTHGDSKYERPVSSGLAAFFAGPLGIDAYRDLALQRYPASFEENYLESIRLARAGAASKRSAKPIATMTVFPDIQQVDVRQAEARSGMRIYFLSGQRASHGHDDRNSFILEAFGQPLLIDRATPTYTHPATAVCKVTEAHNAIAPDGHTQMADIHEPSATLTQTRETDDGKVIIESDASAAWRDWSVRVVRRLTHLRPDVLVVEDVARWNKPTVTWQYWQTLGEWTQVSAGTWQTAREGVELRLTITGSTPLEMFAETYSVDGNLRPVQRLCVSTPRGDGADLVAIIEVRKSSDQPWPLAAREADVSENAITLTNAQGKQVTVERIARG